jgi:DNA-binding transcriptional MerR regulator
MIKRKTLVKLAQHLLPNRAVTERTLRFYEYEGLMKKPEKVGREVWYDHVHLGQLIAIRKLQDMGVELNMIKKHLGSGLDEVLRKIGCDPELVKKLVKRNEDDVGREPEKSPTIREKPMDKATDPYEAGPNDKAISVTVENAAYYDAIRQHLRLGSCFAFLDGFEKEDPLAKKLHGILYGQMSGSGVVRSAVIPVDDVGIDLPGCKLRGNPSRVSELAFVVVDKEVYREGEDTARIFLFNPAKAKEKASLKAKTDGVLLEEMDVELDENGCGYALLATHAPGSYRITVEGWKDVDCGFDVVRYELAPFVVTLKGIRKENEAIEVALEAKSFGSPFDGEANVSIREGMDVVSRCAATFRGGLAELVLSNLKDRKKELSLAISVEDPELEAWVPLQGTAKEDREETAVAEMGKRMSASLLRSSGSVEDRGLHFSESGFSNAPICLESCLADEAVLSFREEAKKVVVLERSLVGNEQKVHDLGDVGAGSSKTIVPESSVATLHVGAFVKGEPWEGHSVVVRPSKMRISIESARKTRPGKTLDVVVGAPKGSSVLLCIRDKRLKPAREPMVAAASSLKKGLRDSFCGKWTGRSGVTPPEPNFFGHYGDGVYWQNLLVNEQPRGIPGTVVAQNLRGLYAGPATYAGSATYGTDQVTLTSCSYVSNQVRTAGVADPALESGCTGSGQSIGHSGLEVSARESQADVLFCELLEVDKKKAVSIRLPDSIGEYEMVAFGVRRSKWNLDWAETRETLLVEKDAYIEPMIPSVAHSEDGVKAKVALVGLPEDATVAVLVNGESAKYEAEKQGRVTFLRWDAVPGVHDVSFLSKAGCDRIVRVVEAPGEETVLSEEIRILTPKERYDVEDGVLRARVLPGMQEEVRKAVDVCMEYSHSCCEQTSAKIVAAMLGLQVGNDGDRDKANMSVVKGHARMKSMYVEGKGFASYPEASINENWSSTAAKRLSRLPDDIPGISASARECVGKLREMGTKVLGFHGNANGAEGPMESGYHQSRTPSADEARAVSERLGKANQWDRQAVSEAAFCAASLVRANEFKSGIGMANEVCRRIGPSLGGALHGTCEALAYMTMVGELKRAKVVSGADSGATVIVDGKEKPLSDAIGSDVGESVEAVSAVALQLVRLRKINLDDHKSKLPFTLKLTGHDGGKEILPNRPAKLEVALKEKYQDGDVLCVSLPPCMSRVMGGAMAKKFQIDFSGKDRLEVDLVTHGATEKPQHWAAVVRNMYDGSRIGSMGVLKVGVGGGDDEPDAGSPKGGGKKVRRRKRVG